MDHHGLGRIGKDPAWIRANPPTSAPLAAIIETSTQTSQTIIKDDVFSNNNGADEILDW